MRSEFENWILSQDISLSAQDLFKESFKCYRISAYMAAFILSYTGFQLILRDRILASEKSDLISDNLWNWTRTILIDTNSWEKEIYEITQRNHPNILNLSENVRNQVTYWRNRRNECIELGGTEISYALVESFWHFIRFNLGLFVVNGSKEELLIEIKRHFNLRETPSGKEFSDLIERIPDSLETEEIPGFIKALYAIFNAEENEKQLIRKEDGLRFFNSLFQLKDMQFVLSLIQFLLTEENFLLDLLRAYPDKVIFFGPFKKYIRHLWSNQLFRPIPKNDFPIFCGLLRNGIIPEDQVKEAIRLVITSLLFGALPDAECISNLENNGFFPIFREVAFAPDFLQDSKWADANAELLVFYLSKYGLDLDLALEIERVFSSENHPEILRDKISNFLLARFDKRKEFANFFVDNEVGIPKYLTPLKTAMEVIMDDE